MPPRQVYGKRSRAVYDPLAVFDSPEDSVTKPAFDGFETHRAGKLIPTRVPGDGRKKEAEAKRKALGVRNANAAVVPVLPAICQTKPQERGRKLVLEEVESDEENQEVKRTVEPPMEHLESEVPAGGEGNERLPQHDAEVDEVPLFCDSHEYDSEDEDETRDPDDELALVVQSEEVRRDRADPQTPSIAVLPPTPPEPDEYSEHCAALLALSHHHMTAFSEWSDQLSSHFTITKIAEASFGEVYRLSLLERLSGFSNSDESVFKVIALRPPPSTLPKEKRKRDAMLKKAENMSRPDEVANEVRLLQRMSTIPGFTNFRDVRVVKGRPPPAFAHAYKAFNAAQRTRKKDPSHFPDPAKKTSYAEDQLWAVIEMQDAGMDLERLLENGEHTSVWSVWDIFWHVVLTLAKGEESADFEHRDLHLGNICVRQSSYSDDHAQCCDTKRKLNFINAETTIIDYTISRASMPDSTTAFHDLALDSAIFEGDSAEEYQYDIYRYMRGAVYLNDPYTNPNSTTTTTYSGTKAWEHYHPITNLLWLHYILYKLLENLDWPSATKAPPRKQKTEHTRWKRANDLEHVLLKVQELLDPSVVCQNEHLRSVSDLVGLALGEGWLDVEDVVGDEGLEASGLVDGMEKLELESVATPIELEEETGADPQPETKSKQTRRKHRY